MRSPETRGAKALVLLFVVAGTAAVLLSNPVNMPLGVTGDDQFREASCRQSGCHEGNPSNDPNRNGSLKISVAGDPTAYEPGRRYTITVTLNRDQQRRWGFQFSARSLNGQQAGTLITTNANLTLVRTKPENGVQYIHHSANLAGTFPGDAGPKSWTFDWQAPSTNVGPVRFSCAGNTANNDNTPAGDFIYTTNLTLNPAAAFVTTLYYPRLVTTDGTGGDNSQYTGIAVANLDVTDANLRFTAFNETGSPISGPGVTNPATRQLAKGAQLPRVDYQIFESGLPALKPVGWFKLESTVAKTVGFFLIFNGSLSVLDGADVSSGTLTSFVFPEVQPAAGGFTQIHVSNPGASAARVDFDLVGSDGQPRGSRAARTLNPNGAVAAFIGDLFPGVAVDGSEFIKVNSNSGVVAFEFLGQTGRDVEGLNGQDATAGGTVLYSPQYVVGGPWRSTMSIVNLDGAAGTVTMRFVGEDGAPIGAERQRSIPANGKLWITEQDFFLDSKGVQTQGYVEIRSSGPRLTGCVVFAGTGSLPLATALPLVSTLRNSVVFSQLASNDEYYTGIAVINPNDAAANVTVDVFDEAGVLIGTKPVSIDAKKRSSGVLTQYINNLGNRSSGYIRITADKGVASFALFGTNSFLVLSAVPPQVAP